MRTLFIETSIDEKRESLKSEIALIEKALKENKTSKLKDLYKKRKGELDLLNTYEGLKGGELKLIGLRKDSNEYIEVCSKLTEPFKGVHYDKKTKGFVVRKTINGKRKYLGTLDTIEDAIEVLQMYAERIDI